MAFDQTTRNRLQRFVSEARSLLTEEFTRQLQQEYGLDPKTGEVADLSKLSHLDDSRLETARVLREILAHYLASEMASSGKKSQQDVLDRIVREQAFTVLNRLAALRMMEARGLLLESVANEYQSRGFQLYERLTGHALGETGDAYRCYLFSVFDELAQDLPGLFDRYSPQGRLFPREAALLQVLALINDAEIEPLWGEDETIGWIYQYFNSKEERKTMREASQAPRNSRELAVRNQFFTPRYVVEFLVDNTLGRLWFNAAGGQTVLRDCCQYLLVKPDEQPEPAIRLRDPRTLKLLDPACGSMHFGLYAFDLFLETYRESWAWEQQHGPGSLDVNLSSPSGRGAGGKGFKPLCQTYADEDAFLRDVPRLVIEHNIYGVDIDPRAAQIASLALWLRAQRAWHEMDIKAKDRPAIAHGHVIAAIAPPAERDLRQQFAAALDKRDAELFEKTLQLLKRLPELGVLLQVERELPHLIRQVYMGKGNDLFAEQEQEGWQKAEARLRAALIEFAQAARASYQDRLFAYDALQGLRLIDLCGEVFDIVVMNPPFGEYSSTTRAYIRSRYADSHQDLALTFVSRAIDLAPNGVIGAITTRTGFFLTGCADWRCNTLGGLSRLTLVADLGYRVLDAVVETSAYIIDPQKHVADIAVINLLEKLDKEASLRAALSENDYYLADAARLSELPNTPLAYWAPNNILEAYSSNPTLDPNHAQVKRGVATGDNFRLLRLFWEVERSLIGESRDWIWYAKGGEYSPYFSPTQLVLRWFDKGLEIRNFYDEYGKLRSRPQNLDSFGKFGVAYSSRTTSGFGPRILLREHGFDQTSNPIIPLDSDDSLWILALLMTRPIQAFIELAVGGGDTSQAGTAARDYTNGLVGGVPIPPPDEPAKKRLEKIACQIVSLLRGKASDDEVTAEFVAPRLIRTVDADLARGVRNAVSSDLSMYLQVLELSAEADDIATRLFDLDSTSLDFLDAFIGKHPWSYQNEDDAQPARRTPARVETKKCYWVNQELEVLAHRKQQHPRHLAIDEDFVSKLASNAIGNECKRIVSYLVGCAFGRWDITRSKRVLSATGQEFYSLPDKTPGALGLKRVYEPGDYPIACPTNGLLTMDEGAHNSILSVLRSAMQYFWGENAENVSTQIEAVLGVSAISEYILQPSGFFQDHLQIYSAHARKAPIYWPLATNSGHYTLWLYYPSLTSQTLYTAVNDFVEPKLKQVSGDVTALRNRGSSRSRGDEKQFETLQTLEQELIELHDTLLKIAQNYRPNHDDGVQITAAPLWPLFRHKPWQKVLKDTWAKLEKGDYDWVHLAMNYWPERVRDKCKTDKSLAIAHGLEDLYEEPPEQAKKKRGRKASGE